MTAWCYLLDVVGFVSMAAKKTADYGIVHCLCRFPAPCSTHCKEQLFNIIMSQLLSLFKNIDDRNLRTRLIRTFLPSKRREPSIGWKNIAFPWHGSAPAAFVFLLTNDPIRHYSPDRGRLN